MWQRGRTRRQGDRKTRGLARLRFLLVTLSPCLLVFLATACGPSPLKGTDLGKERAPGFRLTDHHGNRVSLTDFRGKVTVLTFLYTTCMDECPLIAAKLRTAADQLGDTMNQVAYIAVSTDPENDTPVAVQQFLQQHRLEKELRYLIGTREQLQPVWTSYYIGTASNSSRVKTITHAARVIVIDKAGNQRVDFRADVIPADLVFDVRTLLNE